PDLVERALLRAGFSPSLCHEATAWAAARHDEARAAVDGAIAAAGDPGACGTDVGSRDRPATSAPPVLPVAAPALGSGPTPAAQRRPGIAPRVPPPARPSPVGR